MDQNIGNHYNFKKFFVIVLSIVLLLGTISSIAYSTLTGVPLPNFAYANTDMSDNTGDESTTLEEHNKGNSDTNEKDKDQAKQEDGKESEDGNDNDGDTSSESTSQNLNQQNKCSVDGVLNEETGKCEEIKDDENSNDEESTDSSDPDLCLKIRGQIARAQSQEELDSISIPKQCLASNKEIEPTKDSGKKQDESEIKESSSSSDSTSDDKKSNSDGDSKNSKSKSKNKDSDCLIDARTGLAVLGVINVNKCQDKYILKETGLRAFTKQERAEFQKLDAQEKEFGQGYVEGIMNIFDGTGVDTILKDFEAASSDRLDEYRVGYLYGIQAALAAHDVMMEEALLQKDAFEALGIQPIDFEKLKKG